MDDSFLWTAATVLGLAVLGASAGAVFFSLEAPFGTRELSTLLFVDAFVAAAMAAQLDRHGRAGSTLVGGLAGALGVLCFFAIPLGLAAAQGAGVHLLGALAVLVVAPLVAGVISSSATLYLAWGVERYRMRYGPPSPLRRAP